MMRHVIGLLRGSALEWAEAHYTREQIENLTFEGFISDVRNTFDFPDYVRDVAGRLLNLKQGSEILAEYSVVEPECSWNEATLRNVFIEGLNEQLKRLRCIQAGLCLHGKDAGHIMNCPVRSKDRAHQ